MVDENSTKTDLHLATCLFDCIEDLDLRNIKVLLSEKNANPNTIVPEEGGSSLHLVIASGKDDTFIYEVVELFLKHNGNPNLRCGDVGITPVHVAVTLEKSRILYLLLKYNGDIFLEDHLGNSSIDFAKETGNCEWVTEIAMLINALKDGLTVEEYLCTINGESQIFIQPNENLHVEENEKTLLKNNSTFNLEPSKYDYKKRRKNIRPKKYFFSPVLNITVCENKENNTDDLNMEVNITEYFSSSQNIMKNLLTSDNESIITLDESIIEPNCNSKANEIKKFCGNGNSGFKKIEEHSFNKPVSERKLSNILTDDDVCSQKLMEDLENKTFTKQETHKDDETTIHEVHHILSPIPHCGSSPTLENSTFIKNQHEGKHAFKTPSNFISYNSEVHGRIFDDSFESFHLYKNKTKSNKSDINDSGLNINFMDCSKTILAILEEHKYSDTEQGVNFIERRYLAKPLVLPADESGVTPLLSDDTNEMTLALDTDYDTDTLRYNLTQLGFTPGPITSTTKRVYLKKLVELWKFPKPISDDQVTKKVYSAELQKTFNDPNWTSNLNQCINLEKKVTDYFESTAKKWRGGNTKSSFTYLLLDPRITLNLPLRASSLTPSELWKTFIDSIFYVGKGKRARPYAHLYEAIKVWNQQSGVKSESRKIEKIIDIWRDQCGVVCLHIFQNVIPVEAHTREAAMIQVLGLNNLKNAKSGEYYGIAMNWRRKEKCLLGVYLLYKAMQIFLNEGERQLRPSDID